MDVYVVSDSGIDRRDEADLAKLLADEDTLVWVDVADCDEHAQRVLADVFGFHPIAVRECAERNHVSKVHVYPDHVFAVLHEPYLGARGHVHYIELDQLIGPGYLVTVHGPANPLVPPDVLLRDTTAVMQRIEHGHLRARTSFELSYAVVNALVRRQSDFVADLARESGRLEQRVMLEGAMDDPQDFIEEMFKAWYELLTVRTMAAHSSANYGRLLKLTGKLPAGSAPIVEDIADQFDRVRMMADSQREFLHGVIEFFQTRTDAARTTATEEVARTALRQNEDMRKISAWVAIIAAPTAVTGIFGQNVPFPGFESSSGFYGSVVLIVVLVIGLYVLFKRERWL